MITQYWCEAKRVQLRWIGFTRISDGFCDHKGDSVSVELVIWIGLT